MDGLDAYRSAPLYWASQVIIDHIDDLNDPDQVSEKHILGVLESAYEFIEDSFEEEGLPAPSKKEILSHVVEHILANVATDNLLASENDGWSYLHEKEAFMFFLYEACEAWDVDPNDEEKMREYAKSGQHGTASLVAIELNSIVKGHALFTFDAGGAAEDEPSLEGIFETPEAAKTHMRARGVIAELA